MPKLEVGKNVFEMALNRFEWMFKEGHRVVIALSGGKDSGVCVELAVMAARKVGCLPVEVQFVDEEILLPPTHEYVERLSNRPKEIKMHWVIAHQPNPNPFDRNMPYWFAYDWAVQPQDWAFHPPLHAYEIDEPDLFDVISQARFPSEEGKKLLSVIGIRTEESPKRMMALASMGRNEVNFISYPSRVTGAAPTWPIYDWRLGDIWRSIKENNWDYNTAYDVMLKMGVKPYRMRIGPAVFNESSIDQLGWASKAWPHWFDKVARRIPGIRTAVKFGKRACMPQIRVGETWEQCYRRVNIEEAPEWIRERAILAMDNSLRRHSRHSTTPFPELVGCDSCGLMNSWKNIALTMFMGDVFASESGLPYMPPEHFRADVPYIYGAAAKQKMARQMAIK